MTIGDQIKTLMAELSQVLNSLFPPVHPQFQPSKGAIEIRNAEEKLGLCFPEELRALLLCYNGQNADPIIPSLRLPTGLYSHYWLAGVDEIVENTLHLQSEYADFAKNEKFTIFGPTRNHGNFVVFTFTVNADWLLLDLEREPDGKFGQVVMQSTQPCELIVVADSIDSFLQLLMDGYKSGRFKFKSNQNYVIYGDD